MESHVSLTPGVSINSAGDRFIRLSLAALTSNSLVKNSFGTEQRREGEISARRTRADDNIYRVGLSQFMKSHFPVTFLTGC